MKINDIITEDIHQIKQDYNPNDPENYNDMQFHWKRAGWDDYRPIPHGSSTHNRLYKQVTGKEAPPSPTEKGTLDYLKGAMQKYQDNPPSRGPVIKEPSVKYPQDTIKPIKTIDDPDEPELGEAANAAQRAAIAIDMKNHHKKPKNESAELEEEFDLIESIIERLAEHNGVDAEEIWEDLETLTEDELYAFAVTSEPIMEYGDTKKGQKMLTRVQKRAVDRAIKADDNRDPKAAKKNSDTADRAWDRMTDKDLEEDWQKANKRDKTDGMSQKAVNAYRREHPGSKLKTAVTTKPSKLKKGGKASKRRKSYCSRSRGQMKMHSISCSKTPDKAICKARRRWNC